MHELSITRSIVATVVEHARGRKVTQVNLAVGALSGFDVGAVRFCFDLCTQDTVLSGAKLEVQQVPGRGRCASCGREVALEVLAMRCTCSEAGPVSVLSGQELLIQSMEVNDV